MKSLSTFRIRILWIFFFIVILFQSSHLNPFCFTPILIHEIRLALAMSWPAQWESNFSRAEGWVDFWWFDYILFVPHEKSKSWELPLFTHSLHLSLYLYGFCVCVFFFLVCYSFNSMHMFYVLFFVVVSFSLKL